MLLQDLVDYYSVLTKDRNSNVALPGYCKVKVSFALVISETGELLDIVSLKQLSADGKKEVAVEKVVPEQVKKAGDSIIANFLCENSCYFLGFDSKEKPERAKKCFAAARELHTEILQSVDCKEADALIYFFNNWNAEKCLIHPVVSEHLAEIKSGSMIFKLDGGGFIHENPLIKEAWKEYKQRSAVSEDDGNQYQCLVTGRTGPIARLHPVLKGIRSGKPMGNTLVGFNDRAYESYGNKDGQGRNAPVGQEAVFAYATALNHLLADERHKVCVGDTTIVFWAETAEVKYQDIMSLLLNPSQAGKDDAELVNDKDTVKEIKNIFNKVIDGQSIKETRFWDDNVRFFILGLSPNAARVSVRFFIRNNFGNVIKQIGRHYQDLRLEKERDTQFDLIPVWKLLQETVSENARVKTASPLLAGSVMRAILIGNSYPRALYQAVMLRIKSEKKINYYKASIIKACLTRNGNNNSYKEVLTVALNESSNNKAYILGRLFAVLEKLQLEANPSINTTIKDRYFTSACATPAGVFPTLLKLANYHINKASYGKYRENQISALLDRLNENERPLPKHMTLEEQGVFILGYYHQKNAFYKKSETKGEE